MISPAEVEEVRASDSTFSYTNKPWALTMSGCYMLQQYSTISAMPRYISDCQSDLVREQKGQYGGYIELISDEDLQL